MYINPINEIYKDMEVRINQHLEEMIVKAVRECDIEVDKEELIKALKYDRNQYEKGFADALNKIRAEIESCREDEEPHLCDYRYHRNEGLDMALEIIDKYKAESEDKE